MTGPRRIDKHSHGVPPVYRDWLDRKGVAAGGLLVPGWNAEEALAVMDRFDVETSVLSVSTPGVRGQDPRHFAATLVEWATGLPE